MIELVGNEELGARIKLIGVGGGGGNAVNTMIAAGLQGVEFLVANTDSQALRASLAPIKLQLGETGRGAGANPDVGRAAALQKIDCLREHLSGAEMVFITAGMGGGTGTGGAPVVGRVARELGALTVGVVTKPFAFEGARRARQSEAGIRELKEVVDTLIVIPNQRLLAVAGRKTSMIEAFRMADDVLLQAVRGIADLITVHGFINLDFSDVRTIMGEMGMAIMGAGCGSGENRAVEAAQKAISSPLLEDVSIKGAKGVLINITGGPDLSLHEINEAATLVKEQADEEANIIFGAVIDENMGDEVRITVIATGFGRPSAEEAAPEQTRVVGEPVPGSHLPKAAAAGGTSAGAPLAMRDPDMLRGLRGAANATAPGQTKQPETEVSHGPGKLVSDRKPNRFSSWLRAQTADRRVVNAGTITIDENGEPTLQRPAPVLSATQKAAAAEPDFVLGEADEEKAFDTPAFIRKLRTH